MSDKLPQLISDFKAAGFGSYLRTAADEAALLAGCWVDPALGKYVCEVFKTHFVHSQGEWAGKPFELADWQVNDVVMPLYSWIRKDGTRRFRRASIWIPKKNGKSALASGLAIVGVKFDGEPGAKVLCLANDQEQAGLVFDECCNMVEASDELSNILQVVRSRNRIIADGSSWIQAMSAEHKKSEGKNAHKVIIDEIHKFDERGRLLRESVRYAGRSRRNPLEIVISTSGDEIAGVGREEYEAAAEIRDGETKAGRENIEKFVYIAEAPKGADWTSPETWKAANPSWGITINPERFEEEAKEAMNTPRLANTFKRYSLNIWTSADSAWLDVVRWKDCEIDPVDLNLAQAPCTGALDVSLKLDLASWTRCHRLVVPDGGLPNYCFITHFFLPIENVQDREHEDRITYRTYAQQGWITLTPGKTINHQTIKTHVVRDILLYNIKEFCYDKWNAELFAEQVESESRATRIEIPQNAQYLNTPSKEFEALIKEGRAMHDGNPIMTWQVDSVRVLTDTNGNIRPIKRDSAKRRMRIDGVVTCVMALSRSMLGGEMKTYSGGSILV